MEIREEKLEDETTKVKEEEVEEDKDKETEERVEVKEGEQEKDKKEENEAKLKECKEEGGEERTLKEPPKIKKTRRRRNLTVGWLCSKIVKAFVKKKVLLWHDF